MKHRAKDDKRNKWKDKNDLKDLIRECEERGDREGAEFLKAYL